MSKSEKNIRRSRLSRRLLLQYLFSLVVFVAALCLFVMLTWQFCSGIVWSERNPLYYVLRFIRDYILFFLGLALLGGWTVITYAFLSKPLRYLDEVVSAAESLVRPDSAPVSLSPEMLDTQNELNLVRERTLRDAAAAREAEQRKNDLIVYLAHDLKTPLTSVIGYLSLIQDETEISPALREKYMGVALDKALRLEELINEFFDITRFNLSSISLEKERLNLTLLLRQTAFEFEPALRKKELRLESRLEEDVFILADGDKLARVFDNLLRNAVNYSYAGSTVSLSMKKKPDRVTVRMENQGRTIPPEKLSKIFQQFFRLDSSRSSATGGAGLGLAIAREIVEKHGGSIRAESAGERIVFTVELPL